MPEKWLNYESRTEKYVLVDLQTGTIIDNPMQVVVVAADLVTNETDSMSTSQVIKAAQMHGYSLNELEF